MITETLDGKKRPLAFRAQGAIESISVLVMTGFANPIAPDR
jgi:hypothetical protein